MSTEKQTGLRKGEVAYIFAIVLGLVIGILIRRIRIGIMISVVLTALIGLATLFRFTSNK